MWKNWLTASPEAFLLVALTFVAVYASILVFTRFVGLRSFSKMSAPDFAMTVAVGSLFASSISSSSPSLPIAVFALGCLFFGQWSIAFIRRRSDTANALFDNTPLLLMDGPKFSEENMERANVTRSDVIAKLREANVLDFGQVRAVIFETTGDISVLHTSSSEQALAEALLEGVER